MAYSSLITLQPQRKWLMPAGLEYMLVDLTGRADLRRVFYSRRFLEIARAALLPAAVGSGLRLLRW